MKIIMSDESTAKIHGVTNFNLTHTFMCGQCFRWYENDDGSYSGIAHGKAVRMALEDDVLTVSNTTYEDAENIWVKYLDLERNYDGIKQKYFSDPYVSKAMEFGYGIHILNQDIFECLISFIISTQNQIPRIKKIVSELSRLYGTPIELGNETVYAFPTPTQLKDVTADELAPLKAGYRADYIADAVKKVLSGEINLENIKLLPYAEAKKELMRVKGVGPKVADCILLFSAGKAEAFPVDVWVQRTMRTLYMDENATNKQIEKKAAELFGEYAGFAQQYLFYYARENGGITK